MSPPQPEPQLPPLARAAFLVMGQAGCPEQVNPATLVVSGSKVAAVHSASNCSRSGLSLRMAKSCGSRGAKSKAMRGWARQATEPMRIAPSVEADDGRQGGAAPCDHATRFRPSSRMSVDIAASAATTPHPVSAATRSTSSCVSDSIRRAPR